MIRLNEYVFEQLNISYNIFEANSELVDYAKDNEGWNIGAGGKTAWWKSAEKLIKYFIDDVDNVKYGRENNEKPKESIYLKKKFGQNYEEIIKQCYEICYNAYNTDKKHIKYNEVPFVIQLKRESTKDNVKIAKIYLRSNLKCLSDCRAKISELMENKENANKICKDVHYGFGKSSGQDFEDRLVDVMQTVFLNDFVYNGTNNEISNKIYENDNAVISARNLFKLLKENKLYKFSKIFNAFISNDKKLKTINENNIKQYIFQAGGAYTDRNRKVKSINQIINPETLQITYKNENYFEQVLKRSGAIIADIIINTKPSDNIDVKNIKKNYIESENNPGDENLIFISVKKDKAQLSAININPPFYLNGDTTIFNKYETYDDFNKSNEISRQAFNNLCELFSTNLNYDKDDIKRSIFIYYKQKENERQKSKKLTDLIKELKEKPIKENTEITKANTKETINALIQNIIGGNYIYLNSDGHIKYIPYELGEKLFFEVELGKDEIILNPKGIRLSGCTVKSSLGKNTIPFSLVFRTSDRVKDCPYRLFLSFSNSKNIDNKLSELGKTDLEDNNIEGNINFIQELFGE